MANSSPNLKISSAKGGASRPKWESFSPGMKLLAQNVEIHMYFQTLGGRELLGGAFENKEARPRTLNAVWRCVLGLGFRVYSAPADAVSDWPEAYLRRVRTRVRMNRPWPRNGFSVTSEKDTG